MAVTSIGTSTVTAESVVSGTLVIVNTTQGYTVTGTSLSNTVPIYSLITTPGTTGNIVQIGTAGIFGTGGTAGPTVTSLTVTDASWNPLGTQYVDSTLGGYIEIVGTGFDSSAIAYLNGSALTTAFVDSTKLRITIPPTAAGTYAIMVFNDDNKGTIYTNFNLSVAPAFITPSGTLGSFYESSNINVFGINVRANADSVITYSLASGALPSGVSLLTDGNIRGTTPTLSSNTNYAFVVTATDVELQAASRSFSMTVTPDVVTWTTPTNNTSVVSLLNQVSDNVLLSATSLVTSSITYTGVSLPAGLSIVTGNITGTPTTLGTSNATITATSATTSKFANVTLQFKILEPYTLSNYVGNVQGILNLSNSTFQANVTGGLFFDTTGGNLYYVDDQAASNNTVWQYSMTTSWDITTARQVGRFNLNDDGTPQGVSFKPDGTKMYLAGSTTDTVYEYSLSTPWNVTTASRIGQFSVAAQESGMSQVQFSSDGTKMFVMGTTGDDVNVYSLSTAWQANSASFVNIFVPNPVILNPSGLSFNSAGTRMYISSDATGVEAVYQFNISPAWDILASSNVAAASYTFASTTQPRAVHLPSVAGIFVNSDATELYAIDGGASIDAVVEYSFGTAGDVSTLTPATNILSLAGKTGFNTAVEDFYIKGDGTKIYVVGGANKVDEYYLPTPWDLGSAIFFGNSLVFTATETNPVGLYFKSDGTKMYIMGTTNDRVYEYALTTPWSANTAVLIGNILVQTQESTPQSLFFKPEGDKMYVVGSIQDRVFEYNLSTAWQVNSAVVVGNVSVAAQELTPGGLTFSDDGTKMFLVGSTNDKIYRYNLSTAWRANTATANSNVVVAPETLNPTSIQIGKNGLYIYVGGTENTGLTGLYTGIVRYRLT